MSSLKYIALLLLFIISCDTKEKLTPTPSGEVKQIIKKFELTETIEGVTNFQLKADRALLYEDRTIVYEVILNFYKKGTHYATLISDSGIIFTNTNDMEAMGNVEVVGIDGARLETDLLKWVNAERKIKTDSKVKITTKENKKIEGTHFESDPGLTYIKLKQTYGYSE